jgi:hypothetical protein
MTKQNPQTLKESTDVIIQAIQAKQLREKNLYGQSIGVLDAKGAIDYLPRDMAKLDAPSDTTAHQVSIPTKKTKVLE